MKILTLIAITLAICSCQTFKDYDSELALVANVNEKTGAIEWKWTKATVKNEGNFSGTVRVEGNLETDGKQIIRLE